MVALVVYGEGGRLTLGKLERVIAPPLSRIRSACARAIGLARTLDPQECVYQTMPGCNRRCAAQGAAAWIAPLTTDVMAAA